MSKRFSSPLLSTHNSSRTPIHALQSRRFTTDVIDDSVAPSVAMSVAPSEYGGYGTHPPSEFGGIIKKENEKFDKSSIDDFQ